MLRAVVIVYLLQVSFVEFNFVPRFLNVSTETDIGLGLALDAKAAPQHRLARLRAVLGFIKPRGGPSGIQETASA
jgi:hypothetical protein